MEASRWILRWRWVCGLRLGKRVLHPNPSFCDNYRSQIEMLRDFLVSQGLSVHGTSYDRGGAWKIGVAQAESVRNMAFLMLPHLYKKRKEVEAILDYLDNRITGTKLAEVFNESVIAGNRTGRVGAVDIPYTRQEGQTASKKEQAERARMMESENQKLSSEVLERIRTDIISGIATNGELAKKYGVAPATISRAVFGRN